jgi:serine/threonine-protein kinase
MDAAAFAGWRSRRTGWLYTLPTGLQHEKATRGPDARFFPWGNHFDPSFCNMNASRPGAGTLLPAGAIPADESPYGVRDLAGNIHTFCLTFGPSSGFRTRASRGGAWIRTELMCRATQLLGTQPSTPLSATGVRLVAAVRVPLAEDAEDE